MSHPHALPFMAAFCNGSAVCLGSFVNLSACSSALKVMYGGNSAYAKYDPFAITNNITVIQNVKPLEQ